VVALTEYVKSLNEAFKFSVSLILKVRILKRFLVGATLVTNICAGEREKEGEQEQ
jgi:hypothetical protein